MPEPRTGPLARLLEVAHVLAQQTDVDAVLRTIVDAASTALRCDRASLYQYDREANELSSIVATGMESVVIRHSLEHGITGFVARERQIANVPDARQDARWNASVDRQTGYQTRSILAAPLSSPHDGRLLGVLQLINKAEGPFDSQDEELLVAFCQHAALAMDRARMIAEMERRQRTAASLQVARDLQRRFMPDWLPEIEGYEAATWWFPHEEVGGDYCDLFPLRDEHFGVCIADVSGHGLGPSLIMASVRAALRALLLEHHSCRVLLEQLSRALWGDLAEGMFFTIFLGVLDPARHTLEYANAGHGPALHYRAASAEIRSLESTGIPIGILPDATWPLGPPITLEPGDILLLATDGIVEAMDASDRQFGMARLEALIRTHATAGPRELCHAIGAAVSEHYVGATPPDDLTILAIRRSDLEAPAAGTGASRAHPLRPPR